ncbi:type III secretion protein [Pseudomonas sp. 18.1.10]|uniref:type III secretion protein n=1 Tax=Pseudomonas sp. 18.1.10 TaxID=2969302 RepID=UPI00214FF2D8|nr:type III secretion protein [Pseudomonas sp. 18.1.10]MCR4538170.1 type III secretion protein [Pseudomonas sp. 18.1.10]
MKVLVGDWLSNGGREIALFEGEDEVTLQRQGDIVLMGVQLTSTLPDNPALQGWLRLGAASLSHFQGALAQKAGTGALWLIQSLRTDRGEAYVLHCLEVLLNQRDTWRAIVARLARPAPPLKPTPLRLRSYK